jgi:hypothetical protein
MDILEKQSREQQMQDSLLNVDATPLDRQGDDLPEEESVTEAVLMADTSFSADARKMYQFLHGKPFQGSDVEAGRYGISAIGEVYWNMTGSRTGSAPLPFMDDAEAGQEQETYLGAMPMFVKVASEGSPEIAASVVNMLGKYDRLPNLTGRGTFRAVRGIMHDYLTYTGLGFVGAKGVAGMSGRQGAIQAFEELSKGVISNRFKSAAVLGAGYSSAYDAGLQTAEIQGAAFDPSLEKPAGERALQSGVSTAVGATIGAAIPAAMEGAVKGAGYVVGDVARRQAGPDAELGAIGPDVSTPAITSHEGRISTRLPTAKVIDEDPVTQPLVIGLDEVKRDPKVFEANVGLVKNYPNMTEAEAQLPVDEAAEKFVEHMKSNLLWLHDKVPEDTRQRSRLWYDGARSMTDELSAKYSLADTSVAGVLAALSPQMDWYKNVDLGKRVLSIHFEKRDEVFDQKMMSWFNDSSAAKAAENKTFSLDKYKPMVDAIAGKKYSELDDTFDKALWLRIYDETYNDRQYPIMSPEGQPLGMATTDKGETARISWGSFVEIGKAINSIEAAGDKAKITPLMGVKHKVRSFYNNILDPNGGYGDSTIDTHAVAGALLRPLSGASTEVHQNFGSSPAKAKRGADWLGAAKNSSKTGVQGTYGIYSEAYRRAAAERGILPRQMQSITWEAARGLFTDKFKTKSNVNAINEMWLKYRRGEATLDETRDAVEQFAGGINEPTWKQ